MAENEVKKEKKITKQSLSPKKMTEILQEGLDNKTITRKEKAEFEKEVKTIEEGEGTDKDKLNAVKSLFYEKFVSPKRKEKQSLYKMFREVGKEKKEVDVSAEPKQRKPRKKKTENQNEN